MKKIDSRVLRAGSKWLIAAAIFGAGLVLTGCAPAAMQGRVIQGDISYVMIVSSSDERLTSSGIGLTQIDVQGSESRGREAHAGSAITGIDGAFKIDISNTDLLDEKLTVIARCDGYIPARAAVYLPSDDQRVLVVLKRVGNGADP